MTTKEWWMIFIILLCIWILMGCGEADNCYETDVVDHYVTDDSSKFYTITEPVYKVECK